MKELSDLSLGGWKIDAFVDLSEPVNLNGYVLFVSRGDKKDYLIMFIAEDESGEAFYSPRSKTVLEDRLYGLYDKESKSLTSFGELCVEYGMFTYDEIVAMEEKRDHISKDIRLSYLKRKIDLFENMLLEMPEVRREYEILKNS